MEKGAGSAVGGCGSTQQTRVGGGTTALRSASLQTARVRVCTARQQPSAAQPPRTHSSAAPTLCSALSRQRRRVPLDVSAAAVAVATFVAASIQRHPPPSRVSTTDQNVSTCVGTHRLSHTTYSPFRNLRSAHTLATLPSSLSVKTRHSPPPLTFAHRHLKNFFCLT